MYVSPSIRCKDYFDNKIFWLQKMMKLFSPKHIVNLWISLLDVMWVLSIYIRLVGNWKCLCERNPVRITKHHHLLGRFMNWKWLVTGRVHEGTAICTCKLPLLSVHLLLATTAGGWTRWTLGFIHYSHSYVWCRATQHHFWLMFWLFLETETTCEK